jgi:phage-related protein
MKTLSTPITNEAAAEQSAWAEIYDIYLKSSITTPWGTTNVIRLCNRLGKQFSFFTPEVAPEPAGTRGDAATYYPWPLKREVVKSSGQFTDNKLEITGSNVTAEWAEMVSTIDWYDTPIIIRKTSPNLASATAADCVVIFSGLVDSIRISDTSITLICSNDLALLNRILPSENMHASCRFRFADDQCTLLRFKAENYKSKTVGSSSTTTRIKSAGLTEDAGSSASYGTELVNPLGAPGSISASSEWSPTGLNAVVAAAGSSILGIHELVWKFWLNQAVTFGGGTGAPGGFSTGVTYYVVTKGQGFVELSATLGGSPISATGSGTWAILLHDYYEAFRVKSSSGLAHWWAIGDLADWGTEDNAYFVIPDAQAGLKNSALKPYIQFDFGSAKTPRVWRVASVLTDSEERRVRLILFFSSSDASTWNFESFFEMPNRGGELFDVLIPKASSARYWRICVRSIWGNSRQRDMLYRVEAYENGRHWWRDGFVTFADNTTTVALRGIKRKVLESYSGEVVVQELPAAPASGDTFVIERGCARTFNACCERQNTENYGGFNDLPLQTVIR